MPTQLQVERPQFLNRNLRPERLEIALFIGYQPSSGKTEYGADFFKIVAKLSGDLALSAYPLTLWKVWVRLNFINLLEVTLAVCRNKENKFIPVHFAHGTVHHVIAQPRRGL